jgi:hypothetical protein
LLYEVINLKSVVKNHFRIFIVYNLHIFKVSHQKYMLHIKEKKN